jgi:hypothetical protein
MYDQIVQNSQHAQSQSLRGPSEHMSNRVLGDSAHHDRSLKQSQHSLEFNKSNNEQMDYPDAKNQYQYDQFSLDQARSRSNSNIAYQPIVYENSLDLTYEERLQLQNQNSSMISANRDANNSFQQPDNRSQMAYQNNAAP